MKFAFVVDTYVPDVNGAARSLAKIVEKLRELEHEVRVIRTGKKNATDDVVVPFFHIPKYPEIKIGLARSYRFLKLWAEDRPDVIYIGMESPMGCAAMKAARKLKIPVISGFHTNFHHYTSAFKIGFLKKAVIWHIRKFHRKAHATMVPSPTVMKELEELGFEDLYLMSRGVDGKFYDPEARSEKCRVKWGADEEMPVVGYVGRVSPEKNLQLFFKVLEYLESEEKNFRAVMVGDGPQLKKWQSLFKFVHFTGYKSGVELAEAYASIDVFLFPSMSETFGNSVTEALASGVPVVAYQYAAAEMHIEQGVNGYLAPCIDEEIFMKQAKLALENWRCKETRQNARSSMDNVAWEDVVKKFVEVAKKIS